MVKRVWGCPHGFHWSLPLQFALSLGPQDFRQQHQQYKKQPLTECFSLPAPTVVEVQWP